MAGYGRNYPTLNKKFKKIEMLDGSKEMVKRNPHDVKKYH